MLSVQFGAQHNKPEGHFLYFNIHKHHGNYADGNACDLPPRKFFAEKQQRHKKADDDAKSRLHGRDERKGQVVVGGKDEKIVYSVENSCKHSVDKAVSEGRSEIFALEDKSEDKQNNCRAAERDYQKFVIETVAQVIVFDFSYY